MLDFATLYATHARDVYRFALFLCGEPALADDIAAETFVRAWSAPERVDLGSVKAYLFAIARNLFLHEVRRPARRTAPLDFHMSSPEPSPERRAAARDDLRAVLAELQQLPEIDRAALAMRIEDQMPYEEIARILELSVSAAKVKVHRARLRLAQARARRPEVENNESA
jgi:RNA polymerase sigma-70 factor, ECF subfamily